MFLPRNVDVNQVEELSWLSRPPLNFEVKFNILIFFWISIRQSLLSLLLFPMCILIFNLKEFFP